MITILDEILESLRHRSSSGELQNMAIDPYFVDSIIAELERLKAFEPKFELGQQVYVSMDGLKVTEEKAIKYRYDIYGDYQKTKHAKCYLLDNGDWVEEKWLFPTQGEAEASKE